MSKLYVRLQQPTIELTIKAKDSAGNKDSIIVGFKRYEVDKATKELGKLQELFTEQLDVPGDEIDTTDIDNFIISNIEYIRQANLVLINEDGRESNLSIIDTRKAKPVAERWENEVECLAALLELYLSSAPWRSALTDAVQKALVNKEYDEGLVKN